MSDWVVRGVRTGVKSTPYPKRPETAEGVSPGLPVESTLEDAAAASAVADICPTGALRAQERIVAVDRNSCINCYRCARGPVTLQWDAGYEWAHLTDDAIADAKRRLGRAFGHSLHVRVVDAGDCSACLSEIAQLTGPYYSLHRLGFFITPTPREADALLVVGPVTHGMQAALLATYEAMPSPKCVIAVGACAISGGIFGPSVASEAGACATLPVDVIVPGCPPPPLAVIHALLVAAERTSRECRR